MVSKGVNNGEAVEEKKFEIFFIKLYCKELEVHLEKGILLSFAQVSPNRVGGPLNEIQMTGGAIIIRCICEFKHFL